MKNELKIIYHKLFLRFGPQGWWPADNPLEVIVGAILTQNTNWKNVERAINNLKKENALNVKKLKEIPQKKLSTFIKPAGYFNIKAERLKFFFDFLFYFYNGSLKELFKVKTKELRKQLLAIKGIGPETADSILLYAAKKSVFVVDAYTKRILLRHNFIKEGASYEEIQNLFMNNLKTNVKLFNEYHALLVKLGKEFCLKNSPKCNICPLK